MYFGGLRAWPWWCVFRVLVLVVGLGVWLGCGWCSFEFVLFIFDQLIFTLKKFFFSFLVWGGGSSLD